MKRDILLFGTGFIVLISALLLGAKHVVPVTLTSLPTDELTLILDAGHGGEDGGSSTVSGDKESEINLSIVLKLESLLAFCGQETVLTRREDISLHSENCSTLREKKVSDLKRRTQIVNSFSNPMLISVHQNHFTDPVYSGAQVFYNTGDLSRQWGERTQELLRQSVDPSNHRQAKILSDSVYLFKHISCPSILVECGFLSNGEEASLLLTETYQKKITAALTVSCLRQLASLRNYSGGNRYGQIKNTVLLH